MTNVGILERVGIAMIHAYRFLFGWLPSSCRYEPTCSRYTEQAIAQVRPLPRLVDGRQADRALPPRPSGRLRPRSMSLAVRPSRASGRPAGWASWWSSRSSLGACEPIVVSPSAGSLPPGATTAPGATPAPTPAVSGTPAPTPLIVQPAQPRADPVTLLAWLFNPIFQAFLILLVGINRYLGVDMGIAIILTTLIVRTAMVPLMRRQMVSMRRMQAVAPEISEIQRRYKSDRVKQQQATMALYKERGISQAGCLVPSSRFPDPADVPGRQRGPASLRPDRVAEGLRRPGGPAHLPAVADPSTASDNMIGFSAVHRLRDPVARRHPCRRLRGHHPVRVHAPADQHDRDLGLRARLHRSCS